MCLLLKREKKRKEREATAHPLFFVSHALEKDTRFLNPSLASLALFRRNPIEFLRQYITVDET